MTPPCRPERVADWWARMPSQLTGSLLVGPVELPEVSVEVVQAVTPDAVLEIRIVDPSAPPVQEFGELLLGHKDAAGIIPVRDLDDLCVRKQPLQVLLLA